ncbi:hypothetical protein M8C21_023681 [Ambrosia artemisiifolia]|uniref:Uncharacterized protein n=1 Tax=Ambrosia artemisiifolia TaxID=4212 RepID=A0AAD5GDF8_AMBAR|nr:hypothetical protein M8C21_023681 [Ambrosia artemisiifolia]
MMQIVSTNHASMLIETSGHWSSGCFCALNEPEEYEDNNLLFESKFVNFDLDGVYRNATWQGGYGQRYGSLAKEEKYDIFPDIKEYADVNLKQ